MGINALWLAHTFVSRYVKPGDICIDATAGRGRDTELLCRLTGADGKVFAFDIQKQAIEETQARLAQAGLLDRCSVIQDSHHNMNRYVKAETVSAIVFNFGYLPGGDRTVFTKPESSIQAIASGLGLLKPGGIMSLSIYHGGATGYEERDALLAFLKTLDNRRFTVLTGDFANRTGDPPIPVFIWKE